MTYRIESLQVHELAVPLASPFVIAGARVDVTPNALLEVTVRDLDTGRLVTGRGEAATLHPVTRETAASVMGELLLIAPPEQPCDDRGIESFVREATLGGPARAALSSAIWDARAQLAGVPVWRLLGGTSAPPVESDITISLGDAGGAVKAARRWWSRGFRCFKVKVGQDVDQAMQVLEQLHAALPEARLRVDANAALTAADALALGMAAERHELPVECWEQPCARLALESMAEVAAGLSAPVVADESVASLDDLEKVVRLRAADGVNLKLVKSGGFEGCVAIAQAARRHGLKLMVGAMVETRLGITAAAHLAAAVGGVDYPDLDTAFLMATDPFVGGYVSDGPMMTLTGGGGFDLRPQR